MTIFCSFRSLVIQRWQQHFAGTASSPRIILTWIILDWGKRNVVFCQWMATRKHIFCCTYRIGSDYTAIWRRQSVLQVSLWQCCDRMFLFQVIARQRWSPPSKKFVIFYVFTTWEVKMQRRRPKKFVKFMGLIL